MASQGLVNRDSQFETLLGMKHEVNEYKKSGTKNANNNFSDVIYLIKVINNGIQTNKASTSNFFAIWEFRIWNLG